MSPGSIPGIRIPPPDLHAEGVPHRGTTDVATTRLGCGSPTASGDLGCRAVTPGMLPGLKCSSPLASGDLRCRAVACRRPRAPRRKPRYHTRCALSSLQTCLKGAGRRYVWRNAHGPAIRPCTCQPWRGRGRATIFGTRRQYSVTFASIPVHGPGAQPRGRAAATAGSAGRHLPSPLVSACQPPLLLSEFTSSAVGTARPARRG